MHSLHKKILKLISTSLFANSSWGVISQLLQTIFLSLFFVITVRNYSVQVFANFIIATVLYQLVAAFSTLGLSQWFIREIAASNNKTDTINKFFKLQIYSGALFYVINIVLAFLMYDNELIHRLAIFLGINILFDNLINGIKCINIAESNQRKSFVILSTEAFLKLVIACCLYVYPLSIVTFSIILVIVRFITLNLFLNFGSSKNVNLKSLIKNTVPFRYVKLLLSANWPFLITGSIAILNWRVATIIISKALSANDVANYEISYRLFSIAQMLPVVVSASIFPMLVRLYKSGEIEKFTSFYRKARIYYFGFGLIAFTLIYSFANFLLPFVFGPNYRSAVVFTQQMFLTILIFPTAFLQANVLVAMELEKKDMWFNVISLVANVTMCFLGAYFFKSLTAINTSIFLSFIVFNLLQDFVLVKNRISSVKATIIFYILGVSLIPTYLIASNFFEPHFVFGIFWCIMIFAIVFREKATTFFSNISLVKHTLFFFSSRKIID